MCAVSGIGLATLTNPRTLGEIKRKLESLLKQPTTDGNTNSEDEGDLVAACDLAEDLRDAIIEYQVRTLR